MVQGIGDRSPGRPRGVLFDWDGTLLDSVEACRRSYERLFRSFGIPFDSARFNETYSPDWYRTYEGVGLPREKWAEADCAWLEIYASEECVLVAGAREVLSLLEAREVPAGLVTSGTGERVRRELVRLGLRDFFRAVVCSEDVVRKKPHPEALLSGLDQLGVAPPDAIYLGDSPEDVEMARAAGVYSVGVAGAFPNRKALLDASPDLYAEDLITAARQLWGSDEWPRSPRDSAIQR